VGADDAAWLIARTDSTISRMETGQSSVPARVLERLLELYEATPEECEHLTELARQARQRGWCSIRGGTPPITRRHGGGKAAALAADGLDHAFLCGLPAADQQRHPIGDRGAGVVAALHQRAAVVELVPERAVA
jgi:hypothetical protein